MEHPIDIFKSGNLELVRDWYSRQENSIDAARVFALYCDTYGCTGEIVAFILEKIKDIHYRDNNGNNYIHMLLYLQWVDDLSIPLKHLIDRGVDICETNNNEESVLYTIINSQDLRRIELIFSHLPCNSRFDPNAVSYILRDCEEAISLVAKYQPQWLDHTEVRYRFICDILENNKWYIPVKRLLDHGMTVHPHVFDMGDYWRFDHERVLRDEAGEPVYEGEHGTMLTMTVRNGTMIAPILKGAEYHMKHQSNFPRIVLWNLTNLRSFCWLVYHIQEKKVFGKRISEDLFRRVRTFFPRL